MRIIQYQDQTFLTAYNEADTILSTVNSGHPCEAVLIISQIFPMREHGGNSPSHAGMELQSELRAPDHMSSIRSSRMHQPDIFKKYRTIWHAFAVMTLIYSAVTESQD